jgi:hypothetical protein
VRYFETDVSGLPIGPIFKDQDVQKEGETTSRPVITQKTQEFKSTVAEVYDSSLHIQNNSILVFSLAVLMHWTG